MGMIAPAPRHSEPGPNTGMANAAPGELKRIALACGKVASGFAALWLFFYAISVSFPYIEPGADLVTEYKNDLVLKGHPFPAGNNKALSVVIFGNSKIMTGFVPAQFDTLTAAAGIATDSYNLGVPGDIDFVSRLETLLARGEGPDVALITYPWPDADKPERSAFHFTADDDLVMQQLFPFRRLPRNLFVAFALAPSIKGFREQYRLSADALRQVDRDRGYYFMARQRRYQGDRLPDDFFQAGDDPAKVDARRVNTRTKEFARLRRTLVARHVRCIMVPNYFRMGELAPPDEVNRQVAAALEDGGPFALAGPDYFLYPNAFFGDPVHLNRAGEGIYTRQLADLLAPVLRATAR